MTATLLNADTLNRLADRLDREGCAWAIAADYALGAKSGLTVKQASNAAEYFMLAAAIRARAAQADTHPKSEDASSAASALLSGTVGA